MVVPSLGLLRCRHIREGVATPHDEGLVQILLHKAPPASLLRSTPAQQRHCRLHSPQHPA